MRYFVLAALAILLPLPATADDARRQRTSSGCLVWDPLPQPDETVICSGAYVDGKASGTGTEVFRYRADGVWREERYVGEMRADKLHGRGTLCYDNGDRYEGRFSGGLPNGSGTFTARTGETITGAWSHGCLRQGDRVAAVGTTKERCGSR